MNSPETPLFSKSRSLYGLNFARQRMIETGTAVVVEGYTDVLACHQAGIRHAVAGVGPGVTPGPGQRGPGAGGGCECPASRAPPN